MVATRLREDTPGPRRRLAPAIAVQAPRVDVHERPIDLVLLGAAFLLIAIGTVEIYSSSAVYALKKYGNSTFFLERQLMWLSVGFGAMWLGANISYRRLDRLTYPLLLLSLLLLASVLVLGASINGARRWFVFGPLSFQPVEVAKLALIVYLAHSLSKKAERMKTFTIGLVPHMVVCAVMVAMLLKQPDLGSSIILGAMTLIVLFVAGTKLSYIMLAVLAALPVGYQMIVGTPWRMRRFMAFFNPEAYSHGVAYQVVQSRIAIGSGGLGGAGLGEGRQQLGYMPEGHSDFIMSSVGEELGFIGFALVLILFAIIVWRGVRAAIGARDAFGGYLAFGIIVTFALQAVINTGVVLGALPAKGLTLPLVSYGGSSLVMAMMFVGILLNVGRRPALRPSGRTAESHGGAQRHKERAIIKCGS